ncbi:hypothetical protein DSCW_12790 [Desulfosarcina widdelii]|uniref:Uncharacterized protein n=1 Tax=Desulfosarcina widdelii TaxID=947919 RepID=A0A5K7YVU1_9BACT|nr:hypothetical protein DSCW_12790 [Desulfosarcina widdelii]
MRRTVEVFFLMRKKPAAKKKEKYIAQKKVFILTINFTLNVIVRQGTILLNLSILPKMSI